MNIKISVVVGMAIVIVVAAISNLFIWKEIKSERSQYKVVLDKIGTAEKVIKAPIKNEEDLVDPICEVEKEDKLNLPVVRFLPATFTDKEKKDLMDKVISPYIDYNEDSHLDNRVVSIAINKYTQEEIDAQNYAKYRYAIDAIYEEGYAGWLEGKAGESLDWWVPECMGPCNFSDEFKEKYPEIIEKHDSMQNLAG